MKTSQLLSTACIIAAMSSTIYGQNSELPKVSLMNLWISNEQVTPDERFNQYAEDLAKFDITITLPEYFKPIDIRGRDQLQTNINPKYYGAFSPHNQAATVVDDADRHAAFIFPTVVFDALTAGYGIEDDLRKNKDDMALDVRPLINIITDEDMSQYSNADTAVIYQFDFVKPYLGSYKHCIGIYLRKKSHPAMLMKIALGDQCLDRKDEFIRILLDNIKYGDNPLPDLVKAENDRAEKHSSDLNFPTRHRSFTGILPAVDDETLAEINRVKSWCEAHGMKQLPQFDDETLDALNKSKEFRDRNKAKADSIMNADIPESDKALTVAMVTENAKFPGGNKAMYAWLKKHMKYPKEDAQNGICGDVPVMFTVCADGSVTDVHIGVEGGSKAMQQEAVRLVKSMPDWQPAIYNGKPVKTINNYVSIPFHTVSKPGNSTTVTTDGDGTIYNVALVEINPSYPGGSEALSQWISEHIVYPADAVNKKIEGHVLVDFIINEDGSATNAKVLISICPSLDKEAKRVIESTTGWTPGFLKGKKVKTRYTWPVTFKLAKDK